jgi:SAM-dependent methyltransferase
VNATTSCRQCGATDLAKRGPIARGRFFAGHVLVPVWPGGSLYECRRCALVFRSPLQEAATYEQLYSTAKDTVYASKRLRHDQEIVREHILGRCSAGSVLDVGCFDGALLASLGPGFTKFGVEPSTAAAEICRHRGITVLATSVGTLPGSTQLFDVVCAIDVVEHVPDPLSFIADLKRLVRPGGAILISTGNSSTPVWRLFGGRYWYCSFPEHISFLSPEWVTAAAAELGLNVSVVRTFHHRQSESSQAGALFGFAKRIAASAAEYLVSPFLPSFRRLGPRFVLGFPGVAADHLFVEFVRRGGAASAERTPAAHP